MPGYVIYKSCGLWRQWQTWEPRSLAGIRGSVAREPAEKLFGSKAKLERYPSLVGRDLERSGKLAEAVPRNKPKEVGFANRSF